MSCLSDLDPYSVTTDFCNVLYALHGLQPLYRFDTIIYDLLVQLYDHWARTDKSYVMS